MLLPAILKETKPRMKVGFFLHTPFPSSEIYRTLPVREELLRSGAWWVLPLRGRAVGAFLLCVLSLREELVGQGGAAARVRCGCAVGAEHAVLRRVANHSSAQRSALGYAGRPLASPAPSLAIHPPLPTFSAVPAPPCRAMPCPQCSRRI
jgi:hypothetical protein